MKRDPCWIKFYGIGGGTTKPDEPGSGGGTSRAPIPGGNVAWADKRPGPGIF